MQFQSELTEGRLIKRYKRFLCDIELTNGEVITAHVANTGAMTGCMPAGARVWLSHSDNPKRKYAYSWELVELDMQAPDNKNPDNKNPDNKILDKQTQDHQTLACINTSMTNKVAEEGIRQGRVIELAGFDQCQTEVRYGEERSRIDLLLTYQQQSCFVEVKHVTLKGSDGQGAFPDAVSKRGQKHLRELMAQVALGHRAVMLFIIMRTDVQAIAPADQVDPDYGRLLRQAADAGVEVLAYNTTIDLQGIQLQSAIPVHL